MVRFPNIYGEVTGDLVRPIRQGIQLGEFPADGMYPAIGPELLDVTANAKYLPSITPISADIPNRG